MIQVWVKCTRCGIQVVNFSYHSFGPPK